MIKLDYESRDVSEPEDTAPTWHYLLLGLPLAYSIVMPTPYPMPPRLAIGMYVCVGIALGAAIHILRRRPRDAVAWLSVVLWGGLSLIAIGNALLK